MPEPKRWWIVGASEGLGRALAHRLDAEGASLILSARNAERLDSLAAELRNARTLQMDVTDAASVARAVQEAGEVDGIVYSVGLYEPMSARDWNTDAAVALAEANFIGALRVLGGIVPAMCARGAGHVVVIGSLAGFRGLPGAIGYGASKAALMHLAENLRADLRGSGVRVQLVNPGFIDTRLTRKNSFRMPFLMSAEDAAARTHRAMQGGRFATSFPALFALFFRVGSCLPLRVFQALF
ncbi:MAG: SDR family NAD(P)-dependent oxidoreductase [Rhodobacteraceae bacterium]|nr:SDR family NAD(P)-dependent oxidoreductase [Paracoccaceae bacterium]